MITEDYVNFEIAKLLKEKGFVNDSISCINVFKGHKYKIQGVIIDADDDVTIPTLQMAMKWLREIHNLHCVVDYDYVLGWYCQITSLKETVECDYEEMKHYYPEKDNGFSSPEEASEAAIKYCLENLI